MTSTDTGKSHIRFWIIAVLFIVSSSNYASRATLSFPANARIVANWFPTAERGTPSAIFNASQYFSLVAFAPLMGWLAQEYGWRSVFLAMGGIGLIGAALFWAVVQSPSRHKAISKREYDYIEAGGALVNLDRPAAAAQQIRWGIIGQLL